MLSSRFRSQQWKSWHWSWLSEFVLAKCMTLGPFCPSPLPELLLCCPPVVLRIKRNYWVDQLVDSSVQSLSHVRFFVTPRIAARQASLSITNSRSSLKLTPIESVMPYSHLILCRSLLLLPPIPPSIRVFSNESTLRMRWPKYWSFSFSIIPSKEIPGLIKALHKCKTCSFCNLLFHTRWIEIYVQTWAYLVHLSVVKYSWKDISFLKMSWQFLYPLRILIKMLLN